MINLNILRFSKLVGREILSKVDSINDDKCKVAINHILENVDELRLNPFADCLCRVFSQGKAVLGFEEFLDMMSVMSDASPPQVCSNHLEYHMSIISLGQS